MLKLLVMKHHFMGLFYLCIVVGILSGPYSHSGLATESNFWSYSEEQQLKNFKRSDFFWKKQNQILQVDAAKKLQGVLQTMAEVSKRELPHRSVSSGKQLLAAWEQQRFVNRWVAAYHRRSQLKKTNGINRNKTSNGTSNGTKR